MLTSNPTNYGTGIEIFGDYHDLSFLHSQLHELAGEDDNVPGYWNLVNLAYDVRHAFQGDSLKKDFGFSDLPIKYLGFTYYWIDIILVINVLRQRCAYVPTSKPTQSLLYRLEFLIEDSMKEYDLKLGSQLSKWVDWLRIDINHYTHLLRTKALWETLNESNGKKRFKKVIDEMQIFSPFSDYAKSFKHHLDEEAIRLNCEIKDLEPNYSFDSLKYKW